jgi:hypothetical protein
MSAHGPSVHGRTTVAGARKTFEVATVFNGQGWPYTDRIDLKQGDSTRFRPPGHGLDAEGQEACRKTLSSAMKR